MLNGMSLMDWWWWWWSMECQGTVNGEWKQTATKLITILPFPAFNLVPHRGLRHDGILRLLRRCPDTQQTIGVHTVLKPDNVQNVIAKWTQIPGVVRVLGLVEPIGIVEDGCTQYLSSWQILNLIQRGINQQTLHRVAMRGDPEGWSFQMNEVWKGSVCQRVSV